MPTYLYQCETCTREFEETQRITEDAFTEKRHIKFGGHGEPCDGPVKRLIAGSVSVTWKNGAPTPKHYA